MAFLVVSRGLAILAEHNPFLTCRTSIHRRLSTIAIWVGIAIAVTGVAFGQAREIAQRESEIAPFFIATYLHPDYSQSANFGYGGGFDLTPFFFRQFQPSLEIRVTGDRGPIAAEYTYSGGIKAAFGLRGIHPYAMALKGLGAIYFTHPVVYANGPYARDSSRMFSLGGGADFDLGRTFQAQVDYSKQYWTLDSPALRPMAISVGIAYRIPFGKGKMKK